LILNSTSIDSPYDRLHVNVSAVVNQFLVRIMFPSISDEHEMPAGFLKRPDRLQDVSVTELYLLEQRQEPHLPDRETACASQARKQEDGGAYALPVGDVPPLQRARRSLISYRMSPARWILSVWLRENPLILRWR
jgi:hypothetical protein